MKVLAIMRPGDDRERMRAVADGQHWTVEYCGTVPDALQLLRARPAYTAILLDRDVPGMEWEIACAELAAYAGTTRIILASRTGGDGLWQRVVEQGGHDVVTKPLEAEPVRRTILHAYWYATTIKQTMIS